MEQRSRDGGRKFQYQARDAETQKKRADAAQSGGFDTYIKDHIKLFTPKVGQNAIRILPPTWERPEHWGLDIWVHFNIGPDNSAYLCASKMRDEPCVVCEEQDIAQRAGDTEYAGKLKPTRRVAIWLIDRNDEKLGPMIWAQPNQFDSNMLRLAQDPRTGEVLAIDHHVEGYDVYFERKGQGIHTEYLGLQLDRRPTPLGNDKWLDIITAEPLPETLNYYSYDHVKAVFSGRSARNVREEGASRTPATQAGDQAPIAREEAPRRREAAPAPAQRRSTTPTWESIHAMTWDEMDVFQEREGLNLDIKSARDEHDLADWICEVMKLAKAPDEPASRGSAAPSASERLRRMREGDR